MFGSGCNCGKIIFFAIILLISAGPACISADDSKAEVDAIYNYKKWLCKIDGNKLITNVSVGITVYNVRGEKYNSLALWENDFTKLKKVNMSVYDADGDLVYRKKKKDMEKVCGYDNIAIYADICYYYTELGAAQFPYTIEYEYTKESNTLFAWNTAVLQHKIPVLSAIYSLQVKPGFEFHHKVYGMDVEPLIISGGDGKTEYVWEVTDIPALPEVDYVPSEYTQPTRIVFSPERFSLSGYKKKGHGWKYIGRWYADMARDRYLRADDSVAIEIGAALDSARSAYNDVVANTRYVAVSIGVGGWQPHKAEETKKNGFGDCKDMSTLLVSRLRNMGLTAEPCLALTKDNGLTDVDFPNDNFNHVIAMTIIGEDTVWMDPTCNFCPFGDIPSGIEDIDVLAVSPGGGELRRTPASTASDNAMKRFTKMHVGSDRIISMETVLEVSGNFATSYRYRLEDLDSDDTRRFINGIFPGAEKSYRISSYRVDNLYDIDKPLVISTEAKWLKPARKIKGCIYIDPYIYSGLSERELTKLEDRTHPLSMRFPSQKRDSIILTWDSSLVVDSISLPADDSLLFSFGRVAHQTSREPGRIVISIEKCYHEYAIPPEQFEEFIEMRLRYKDIIAEYIKLVNLPSR